MKASSRLSNAFELQLIYSARRRQDERFGSQTCLVSQGHCGNRQQLLPRFQGRFQICFKMPKNKWMEHGSLNLYVKKNRSSLTPGLMINFCRDIADGMEYLAGNNLIHRDLAARNCLLDDKMRVKGNNRFSAEFPAETRFLVADFGLSRSHAQGGHFSKRNSILRNLPIPVKWMSPESLKFHFYDERSDVWSFGIVIWEIFSYGAGKIPSVLPPLFIPFLVPFPKAPTEPTIFLQYLEKGNRPKKPQDMPDKVHAIMKKCLE